MGIASRLLEYLQETTFYPGYGPEWGSGGIFGLKYHRGVLYFTLAFEAKAYFSWIGGRHVYGFEHLGGGAKSGGDTYNASAAVDDEIFFGGWVHAQPTYITGGRGSRELDFTSKYSHVHVYDTREQTVRLLWKESIHDPRYWAGEVSEVLYDPIEDLIYIARGDGHDRLGVYTLTREARAERVAGEPVLKGAIHLDHACFTLHGPGEWHPFRGITCIELGTRRRVTAMFNPDTAPSPDGHGVDKPRAGSVSSVYTRLAVMVRGGLVYGDPLSGEDLTFYRLLDFYPSHYGPLRVNTVIVSGAPLTAWNMMTHSTVVGSDEMVSDLQRRSRDIVAPSLLVYFDGPTPRIVGSMGARVTSIEVVGGEVLIGSSTAPNLERYDVTRLDAGVRSLNVLSLDSILTSNPPPVTIRPPRESYAGARTFGGVPLRGYRRPIIRVKSRGGGRLTVYSYMIGDPPGSAEADTYTLEEGWNTIDLSSHHGYIVSFSVEARADDVRIMLS